MRTWAAQEAKAKFSELLDRVLDEGPQLITRRGAEAAVLVPAARWRELEEGARPDLKTLLLKAPRGEDLPLEPRGQWRLRPVPELD